MNADTMEEPIIIDARSLTGMSAAELQSHFYSVAQSDLACEKCGLRRFKVYERWPGGERMTCHCGHIFPWPKGCCFYADTVFLNTEAPTIPAFQPAQT